MTKYPSLSNPRARNGLSACHLISKIPPPNGLNCLMFHSVLGIFARFSTRILNFALAAGNGSSHFVMTRTPSVAASCLNRRYGGLAIWTTFGMIYQKNYIASVTEVYYNFVIQQGYFMNCLNISRRASVVAALVEGNSINATCRMTGVAKHTVLKLLKDLGLPATTISTFAISASGASRPMRFGPS